MSLIEGNAAQLGSYKPVRKPTFSGILVIKPAAFCEGINDDSLVNRIKLYIKPPQKVGSVGVKGGLGA